MDRNTTNQLLRISEKTKEMQRQAVINEDYFKEERESLRNLANDRRVSLKQKETIKKILEDPVMHERRETIDHEKSHQIEKEVERGVQDLIRSGRIPKPQMDAFIKKTIEKTRR